MTSNNCRIEHILSDIKYISDNILVLSYEKKYYETISKIIINHNELLHIEKIIVGHSIFNIIKDSLNNLTCKTKICHNENIEEHNTIVLYFDKKYLNHCIQNTHYIGTYTIPFYLKCFKSKKKFNLTQSEFNNLNQKQINSYSKVTTFVIKTPNIYIELVKPIHAKLIISNNTL